MNDYLIIVDMQNDFITGSLGTPEALAILPKVIEKAKSFKGRLIFTADTHAPDYLKTQEGKNLPVPHCIENTEGWQLPAELEEVRQSKNAPLFKKPSFGSLELAKALAEEHAKTPITSIELAGLCTDICVITNALVLKTYLPEVPVYIDGSCSAGVTPETHSAALKVMASCQIYEKQ